MKMINIADKYFTINLSNNKKVLQRSFLKLAENQVWVVLVTQSLFTIYSKKIYSAVGSFSRQRPQMLANLSSSTMLTIIIKIHEIKVIIFSHITKLNFGFLAMGSIRIFIYL